MASAPSNAVAAPAALATTYNGDDPVLLRRIAELVDVVEIAPDAVAHLDGERPRVRRNVLDEYVALGSDVGFTIHGIGLSIGSFDDWNAAYLQLVDELFETLQVRFHSEHLGCTIVAGENLGTMLTLPRTTEALDLVSERIERLKRRYRAPFLLEHVAGLLPEPVGRYTRAGFLNALTSRTGCGLVLDAYNLECDAQNHGLDVAAFLDELDLSTVREVHLAGGVHYKDTQLDVHSRRLERTTLDLGVDIVRRARTVEVVTYEFLKEAIPALGHDAICEELRRVREALAA